MIIKSIKKNDWWVESNTFLTLLLCLLCALFPFAVLFLIESYPSFIPIWFTIIFGLLLTEIIFWLTPTEKIKKKESKFRKTLLLKLGCLFDVLVIFSFANGIYLIIKNITKEMLFTILKWIGYIGTGVIILGIISGLLYLWIKLNERKFKK